MKRITLFVVGLGAAVGAGYAAYPAEFAQYADVASKVASRVWDKVEANPVPIALALGTFLLTVVYHKMKGKSLRESVEVAATRVTVLTPPKETVDETPVIRRAKARATRTQLLSDQIGLQNRYRKLPEEVHKGEKEVCYAQQALDEAEQKLTEAEERMEAKIKAHDAALAKLEAIRKEKAGVDAELAAIEAELQKLVELV
jgi:chromosome segregation ATPase